MNHFISTSIGTLHVGVHGSGPAMLLWLGVFLDSAANAATVTARFEAVPFGKYAVAVFQDENGNGRLDTTLGIPTEPYAFSNQATVGLGGPPSF